MKKIIVLIGLLIPSIFIAQVKDISLTISPTAEYTFWDNKAGLNDGLLIGGKLGFGFGEYLELRGVYLQSLDLKTNFENFGLANYDSNIFTEQNAKLTRWGGEFKANIGAKGIKPYLTLGTGIQNIEINTEKLEQVYASIGLGFKLNLSKRAILAFEAKNTTYNFNAGSNLLSESNKEAFGVTNDDFFSERLSNWAVLGSLEFYLGGRKPGVLTELDQAYLDKFKGGFKGLKLIVEPSVAHISFDEKSLLRDTYFLGGYVGLDFNEYIGLRGFYFKGTENDEISTRFNELSMYGIELRARLNDGNGVTPYLILGGGYLNPNSNYLGKEDTFVKKGEFASGGLGLNIPLGKGVLISGGLRALVSSGQNVEDISSTADIQTHIMYNAGIKFALGKKSKSPETVLNEKVAIELKNQSKNNEVAIGKLKVDYELKLKGIEEELQKASKLKDIDTSVRLLEEKQNVQKALNEVNEVSSMQIEKTSESNGQQPTTIIQMTPAEFESLIDRILKGINEESIQEVSPKILNLYQDNVKTNELDSLTLRVEQLELMLLESKNKSLIKDVTFPSSSKASSEEKVNETEQTLSKEAKNEIEKLNKTLDKNSKELEKSQKEVKKLKKNEKTNDSIAVKELKKTTLVDSLTTKKSDTIKRSKFLRYNNSSLFAGYNFGDSNGVNLGMRAQFNINNSSLLFVPEAFIGFGNDSNYGVTGNIVYPITFENEKLIPYVGAGIGVLNNGNDFKGMYTIIVGTELPFINKNLFIDYSIRNGFDLNQLAIGYKLHF